MRQANETETEKIKIFAALVWEVKEELGMNGTLFLDALVNMIAFALPNDLDEEDFRALAREFYTAFVHVANEKKAQANEYL